MNQSSNSYGSLCAATSTLSMKNVSDFDVEFDFLGMNREYPSSCFNTCRDSAGCSKKVSNPADFTLYNFSGSKFYPVCGSSIGSYYVSTSDHLRYLNYFVLP